MKNFRLNAKKVFLTYPQIGNNEIKLEQLNDVLEDLKMKLNIKNYLISLEKHKNDGKHLHILFILSKRCNFVNPNCLDISINEKIIHGNYQTAKNINALIEYIIKDGEYITDMKFEIINNKIVEPEEYIFLLSKKIGIIEALDYYQTNYPARACKKLANLKYNLEISNEINRKMSKDFSEITIKDFDLSKLERKEEFNEWLNKEVKKTLILTGLSGVGKSLLAQAIMKELQINYLRTTHYEGLKNLSKEHKGFILDDVKLKSLSEPEIINLFDTNQKSDLRLLYKTLEKDKNLIQILTINSIKDILKKLTPAINRRCLIMNINKPIINITINNNFYLNNKKNEEGNLKTWNEIENKDKV